MSNMINSGKNKEPPDPAAKIRHKSNCKNADRATLPKNKF